MKNPVFRMVKALQGEGGKQGWRLGAATVTAGRCIKMDLTAAAAATNEEDIDPAGGGGDALFSFESRGEQALEPGVGSKLVWHFGRNSSSRHGSSQLELCGTACLALLSYCSYQ